MLSESKEDFIRAIYVLREQGQTPRFADIASYLSVSRPSVTQMAQELRKDGMVDYAKYNHLMLTEVGDREARRLTERHRLIELFLADILHLRSVHKEAHRLEHAFSDDAIRSMRKILGNPRTDPHGSPIPGAR